MQETSRLGGFLLTNRPKIALFGGPPRLCRITALAMNRIGHLKLLLDTRRAARICMSDKEL